MRYSLRRLKHWQHGVRIFFAVMPFIFFSYMAYYRPDLSLFFGIFSSWPVALFAFLLITPVGKLRLGKQAKAQSTPRFWLKMLFGHSLWLFLISTQALAFFSSGPEFTSGLVSWEDAQKILFTFVRYEWGFYPWGIYLLWGVSLAYFTYCLKGVPFHHRHAAVLWSGFLGSIGKRMTEYAVMGATALVYILSIGSALILIYRALQAFFDLPSYYLAIFPSLLAFMPVIFLSWLCLNKRILRKWARKGATLAGFVCISLILGTLTLFFAANVAEYMKPMLPMLPFQTCRCVETFYQQGPDIRFGVFIWAGLMLWAPLAGSFIAKQAQGRTLREVIAATLLPPIALVTLIYFQMPLPSLKLSAWADLMLGCSVIVLFYCILKGEKNSRFFAAGFMPIPSGTRFGVLDLRQGTKCYGLSHFGQTMIMGPLLMTFLHTMGGWLLLQFLVVTLGPLLMLKTAACMIIAIIVQWLKTRQFKMHV